MIFDRQRIELPDRRVLRNCEQCGKVRSLTLDFRGIIVELTEEDLHDSVVISRLEGTIYKRIREIISSHELFIRIEVLSISN